MHKNGNLLEQDLKKLEENNLIDKVAFILRSILKIDKTTLPAVMKMEDLINGECTIPEKLDRFFKVLIGGKDIRHRDGVNFIAFDNFDRYVDTLTGKDTLHDTVGIIYQNVSDDYDIELNSSSISGNLDIPLPPAKEDGLLTRKFQNYRRLIIDCKLNGLVEGKHFNRCKRLHPLMALGLKMLHFDHSLDNIEYNFLKEQVIDDLLHYQEVIDSHSSIPIQLPNNVLSRVLSAYQKFVEETRQDNLNKVDETHPGLKNDFMNGCFGIKRTDKPFSSIPIDLTLEKTINAEAARCLSGKPRSDTYTTRLPRPRTKSHSIRAITISHVLDVCGLKQLQDVSADLQPNRIKIYGKQLSGFNEIFENNINPFDESLDKDSLYNIATAKPVPENVANFLLDIEKNGEDLRKQFITECAEDQNRDLISQ
ncbi:uncharacterized protein TNCV_1985401 [Trichonephila clavipes]|nr:uncharacterized protein TNCV_1985401 [Trichonephila clavipes]